MMDDELKKLLTDYHGPVTRCRAGYARGKKVKPLPIREEQQAIREGQRVDVRHERKALKDDEAARWLCEHDPVVIAAERRRVRREERRKRWLQQQRGQERLNGRPPLWAVRVVIPRLNAMLAVPIGGEVFFRHLR
jgi:hypothetical protein